MHKELIRVGTSSFVNKSKLNQARAFDLLYGGFYEFIHLPHYSHRVNSTWTGTLGLLMNDTSNVDWK